MTNAKRKQLNEDRMGETVRKRNHDDVMKRTYKRTEMLNADFLLLCTSYLLLLLVNTMSRKKMQRYDDAEHVADKRMSTLFFQFFCSTGKRLD